MAIRNKLTVYSTKERFIRDLRKLINIGHLDAKSGNFRNRTGFYPETLKTSKPS